MRAKYYHKDKNDVNKLQFLYIRNHHLSAVCCIYVVLYMLIYILIHSCWFADSFQQQPIFRSRSSRMFYNVWNIFIVIRYRDLMLFQMLFLCLWDINHKSFIGIHTERAQKRQSTWNDYLAGICDCIKRSSRPAQIFMNRILLCKGYESHYGNY